MLRGPGKRIELPVYSSNVPTAEDFVVLPMPLLKVTAKLGTLIGDLGAKWGLGGDAGEVVLGVNIKADHIEVVTTKEGCRAISAKLGQYQTVPPNEAEKKLERGAEFEGKSYPVFVKSEYAEFVIDQVRVEVYGDLQIKVGEWDWGDPLDFEPTEVIIMGSKFPVMPLRLKSELYMGLGWLDRVQAITEAVIRSHHH